MLEQALVWIVTNPGMATLWLVGGFFILIGLAETFSPPEKEEGTKKYNLLPRL
jgi:hypothetical protein